MPDPLIRVLLAEDQDMVRGALAALLGMEPDIEVVAEVRRGDAVLAAALESKPDVALLDIEMPGLDGISAAALLRRGLPGCRVLMLTTFGRPGYIKRALAAGASGFLHKEAPAAELAVAIRRTRAASAWSTRRWPWPLYPRANRRCWPERPRCWPPAPTAPAWPPWPAASTSPRAPSATT